MKKHLCTLLAILTAVTAMLAAFPLAVFAADPALQKTALELYVGETDKIEVLNAAATVTWSSTDEKIVSVAADGTLTAKAVGQTTVTAKTGGKTLTCTVYVVEKEYDFNDQIMISVFWPPDPEHTNEEQYKLMADAGINLMMGAGNGCDSPDQQAKMAELAYKYGIKLILSDGNFGDALLNQNAKQITKNVEKWRNVPAVNGYYLKDEPYDPNTFLDAYAAIKEADPNSLCHLNFLQYAAYANLDQWKSVLDTWCKNCNGTGHQLDYIMHDLYPFPLNGNGMHREGFLANLRGMHDVGLANDVKTGLYLQSVCQQVSFRRPSGPEIRYQAFMALAYGYKQLSYFTWFTPVGRDEPFADGIIAPDGTPNAHYEDVKAINADIHGLGTVLARCDALEIYLNGNTWGEPSIPEGFVVQPTNNVNYTVSRMRHKDTGRNYLMVVNNDYGRARTVTLKLDAAVTSVELVSKKDGSLSSYPVTDGELTVELAAGDGALFALPATYQVASDAELDNPPRDTSDNTNLAASSKIYVYPSADSTPRSGHVLNDGKAGLSVESWSCEDRKNGQYVIVDLLEELEVNRMDLYPSGSLEKYGEKMPKALTVWVSSDKKEWTEAAKITGYETPADGTAMTVTFDTVKTRYIRITFDKLTRGAVELSEIEVFHDTGKVPPAKSLADQLLIRTEIIDYTEGENLAVGKKTYYRSALSGWGFDPSQINDGNWGTPYSSQIGENMTSAKSVEYVIVDLGDTFRIDEIVLVPGGVFPPDYELQISADGVNWTTYASRTGDSFAEGETEKKYQPENGEAVGRFVRFYATKLGISHERDGYLLQFAEIEVYGAPVCDREALKVAVALYESEGCDTAAEIYTSAKTYLELEHLTQSRADDLTEKLLAIAAPPPPETEPETEVPTEPDTTEEPTTAPDTDETPETDVPTVENTTAEPGTESPAKGGCASSLGMGTLIALLAGALCVLRRRKET